jgi:hypothetical protein
MDEPMSNREVSVYERSRSAKALGLLMAAALLASASCARGPAPVATGGLSASRHQDLLVGYGLLANTLSDESDLGKLELFKKVTLNSANDAIAQLMTTLSDASKRRAAELSKLRHLSPDVTDKPAEDSAIGDAINDVAKEFGKIEMLSRTGGFDVRFVLVQAQATRMVAAMATATVRFEPNPKRKAWLKSVAHEYEGYRGDLIKYLDARDAKAKEEQHAAR